MKKYTHEKAHEEIDHIFKTLLPQRGMAERPEQIRLCHSILDAMLDGSIALCDAGTGIGKTFAYLTAGILHGKCRAAEGKTAASYPDLHLQHRAAERHPEGVPAPAVQRAAVRGADLRAH